MYRLFTIPQTCRLSIFLRFVAVRSITADNSLLQPTGCVNTTPHTVHFHSNLHAYTHTHGSSLGPHSFHHMHGDLFVVSFSDCLDISLITLFFLLPVFFIFQDVVDKSPVQTPLRTLGTLSENESPTFSDPITFGMIWCTGASLF